MFKYVIKRLLLMIPVMIGVLFIVFFISYITPGDAATAILGANYTPEAYAELAHSLGIDRPFIVQFLDYLSGIVTRFDLGDSYVYHTSVAAGILSRIGITLRIGLLGVLLTIVIGLPIGIISATKQHSLLDNCVTVLSMVMAAMPGFWIAMMLMILFALNLRILPASGVTSWKGYILPVVCNAMASLAVMVRMTRSSMLEVIHQDYIRTARAKGLSERRIVFKHALKNALMPVITVVGMQISMIMGGSVIIETIFNINGIGLYMLQGINSRDYPIICGCVLVISLTVCMLNLVVDLVYAFIDPRVKSQYAGVSPKRAKMAEGGGENEQA